MPSFDTVKAAARALEVLRLINELGPVTVTHIHKKTGIAKATVLRMIETLTREGYVARQADASAYLPTGKCLLLSNGFQTHARLADIARPILLEFRRRIGWPYVLSIFDHDAMLVVLGSNQLGLMSQTRVLGARIPLLVTALGRAYLAFCEEDEVKDILGRLRLSRLRLDAAAAARPNSVLSILRETRKLGYSQGGKEYLASIYDTPVSSLGVPVIVNSRVVAAINVSFLPSVLSLKDGIRTLVPGLKRVAQDIAARAEKESLIAPPSERALAADAPPRAADRADGAKLNPSAADDRGWSPPARRLLAARL